MAKQRTEKSKYISKYSEPGNPEYLDDNKYLIEIILERVAIRDGKKLPILYWKKKEWLREFLAQLKHAKYLLDKYELKAVLWALNHRRCKKIYSLGLKSVIEPLCVEGQKVVSSKNNNINIDIVEIDTTQKPRKQITKTNVRGL